MDWDEFKVEFGQNVPPLECSTWNILENEIGNSKGRRGTFLREASVASVDPPRPSGTPHFDRLSASPEGGERDSSTFWERLKIFHDFFLEQARIVNLMGPGGIEKILTDHFYDCLVGFPYMGMEPGKKFVDLGTGGGFPGMLLKIYEPGLELDLVEAKGKKVAFLKEAAVRLGFSDINVYQMGIENVSKSPDFRGQYDGVTARGLSDMGTLMKWTKPLLKPGTGRAYFYKAEGWRGEAPRPPKGGEADGSLQNVPRGTFFERDPLPALAGTPHFDRLSASPVGGEASSGGAFLEINLDHHGLGRRLVVWGGGSPSAP
jgi:16S rRNA (guanine(527)-N(7))-methyltransferase RsmG